MVLYGSRASTTDPTVDEQTQKELEQYGMTKKEWNRLKYGWSKYGSSNFGLVKQNITEDWTCQACGERQEINLPSFMFEFLEREFIRICSKCQNNKITNSITTLDSLIKLCRKS